MFMPLEIAYAITIHRCQGLEAGFHENDRWNRIVMDPSDVDWEIRCNLGTLYVATSRGKSLGSRTERFPTNSAIYWTGMGTGIDRLKNCRYKKSGEECEAYKKRQAWVDYLKTRIEATKEIFNQDKVNEITETTLKIALEGNLIEDESDLRARIATMIKQPNENWKRRKIDYQLPEDYFEDA
jgi:hypothetical protein